MVFGDCWIGYDIVVVRLLDKEEEGGGVGGGGTSYERVMCMRRMVLLPSWKMGVVWGCIRILPHSMWADGVLRLLLLRVVVALFLLLLLLRGQEVVVE